MSLKNPAELFEQRRNQSLVDQLVQKKLQEEIQLPTKRIVSPKELFGVVEQIEEEIIEEVEEEIVIDPYLEEIGLLRNDLERVSLSIPEETDLTKVFQDIHILRNRIDNLPKQKDYSGDIESIREELAIIEGSIPVPEVFDPSDLYENISALKSKIEEVRSEIPTIPEPIFYDYQLDQLKEMVVGVRNSIPVVPEIRYYEDDLNKIINAIEEVRSEIPELPEIKYYDNEIFVIENRLIEIQNSIPEVKYYDKDVKELKEQIKSVKKSIPTVPEVKYYDEDVKELKEEIASVKGSIPEVKYYDEEVKDLYRKVSAIKIPDQGKYLKQVKEIYSTFEQKNHKLLEKVKYLEEVFEKFNEETLTEGLLNEPPDVKNSDPLTPLDQNFVTLDQLKEHYRLFINRIQQQLSTIGGGGETRLEFLDDIDRNSAKVDGKILAYNATTGKWIGTTGGGGTQTLDQTLGYGNTSSFGMSVGIITATSFFGDGSGLTGITAAGSGVVVQDNGSNVGTAATLNFGDNLNVSFSGGVATIDASTAGIATYATSSGIATYATNAGIATYADRSGIATYTPNAGIATYATSSGIATYATNAGIATYADRSGIATYANTAGISTYATNAGIATYATRLQNARTFEITGDIVGAAVSFDGTGNVSIAATIQPNSVGLGTDTTGDYVQSISGVSNQILVTGGTGEGSTPTVGFAANPTIPGNVTIGNDLQINNNLNVNGNITIGGTTAYILVENFRVSDADIILGFTTSGSGQDISNDTTASHGGVAVASTEGSPLVDLNIAGIETLPPTYKKIMWFKAGSFAGLNTDAWLTNYAFGVGTTQMPAGARFAAGNFVVGQDDITAVRNINSTGIISATEFVGSFTGNVTTATYASTAGIATYATSSGIATYATTAGIATYATSSGIATYATSSGIATYATSSGIATYATSSGIATYATNAGIATNATYATSSGIATYSSTAGISTVSQGLTGTPNINVGVVTATTFYGDGSQLTGISASGGVSISTNTTNQSQYIPYVTGTGSTTGLGVTTTGLTFNPSTGNMVVSGTVTANSDEKLKTNIQTIPNALEKVLRLRGVEYDRIDTLEHQIGVIAQEVEKIVPEVVYPKQPAPSYETKSVAYANLIGLLIEAIKEQNVRIEELERRLGEL